MNNRRFVDIITESAANYPEITFSRKGAIYTCVNPFSYHLVRRAPELYAKMDGMYVDGILMCKLINLLWKRNIPRLSFDMSGMAADLFAKLNESDDNIYFIGSEQEILEKTILRIHEAFPGMRICGYRNGYFKDQISRKTAIENIIHLNPTYCVIGMGSPLQEQFAIDLKSSGYQGIAFTCGGFLHQTAKNINYYPEWINRYNLRAFYRLLKEKGLFKRLYNVLFEFPLLFIIDTITTKSVISK